MGRRRVPRCVRDRVHQGSRDADALAPVLEERGELGFGRLRCDAVLQPPDHLQDVVLPQPANHRVHADRQPDLRVVVHDVEAGRHDADDVVRPAVDLHGLPDDRLPAKRRLPQFVREDRDRRAADARARRHRIGLARREEPSLFRLHAKGRQQMVVHQRRAHPHRAIARREIDRAGPAARAARRHAVADGEGAEVRERPAHLAELEILGCREPEPLQRAGGRIRREAHQLLRRRISERPQNHAPEDREDRRVGADAERQRQQRDGGEHGAAPKRADPVAQIAPDLVQPRAVTRRSDALLRLFHAAEMQHRGSPRLLRRGAVAHVVGRGHLHERLELVVQIALSPVSVDHPAHDGRQAIEERHAPSRTPATANETRFQRSRCCSSCFRPEVVRR